MTRVKMRIYDKRTERKKDVLMERIDDKFDRRHRHSDRKNREVLLSLANALDNSYELIYDIDEDEKRMHGTKNIFIKNRNFDIGVNMVHSRRGPHRLRLNMFQCFTDQNQNIEPVKVKLLNDTFEAFQEIMKYIEYNNNKAVKNNLQNGNNLHSESSLSFDLIAHDGR